MFQKHEVSNYDCFKQMLQSIPEGDGCLEWPRSLQQNGYAQLRDTQLRRHVTVHRLAYMYAIGPIPEGLHICHRCDNRRCFRPSHLFAATCAENQQDCIRKGRKKTLCGEAHANAKLTTADIMEIRRLYGPGRSMKSIATQFGVKPMQVCRIVNRRAWKHVHFS